jgi:hypothetical protein
MKTQHFTITRINWLMMFKEIFPRDSSLMMEAVRTSETSVDNHFTRQYNQEDSSEHHTRRRENLKSHEIFPVYSENHTNAHKYILWAKYKVTDC